jgi:hypothetical protein
MNSINTNEILYDEVSQLELRRVNNNEMVGGTDEKDENNEKDENDKFLYCLNLISNLPKKNFLKYSFELYFHNNNLEEIKKINKNINIVISHKINIIGECIELIKEDARNQYNPTIQLELSKYNKINYNPDLTYEVI